MSPPGAPGAMSPWPSAASIAIPLASSIWSGASICSSERPRRCRALHRLGRGRGGAAYVLNTSVLELLGVRVLVLVGVVPVVEELLKSACCSIRCAAPEATYFVDGAILGLRPA
ncbi:MAG: hypothetical protein U0470_10390 [Anaerolineae bacterium]